MRNFVSSLILVGLFSGSLQAYGAELAPDWTLLSADGKTVRLQDELRQQSVVLFFWATWCPYCEALMPHLQSIRLEHGDDLKILAINFREKADPVGFIKDAGYDFVVLPKGDEVAELYDIYGTPGLIVVDQGRQIRFDLRDLPQYSFAETGKKLSHKARAAYLAPYWAAELRKSIDAVRQRAEPGLVIESDP